MENTKEEQTQKQVAGRKQRLVSWFLLPNQDYLLGKKIIKDKISVMRLDERLVDGDTCSSCNQRMSEDCGHNGAWLVVDTPYEAVKRMEKDTKQENERK